MEDGNTKQKRFIGLYISLSIIIALQLINIFLGIMNFGTSFTPKETSPLEAKKPLPDNISEVYRDQLVSELLEEWNNKNTQALYDLLGESAKNLLPFEKFQVQCKMLFNIGKITDAKYVSYEYSGKYLGAEIIDLYYTVKIDSQPGTMSFSILNSDNEPQVMRFDVRPNP